LLGLVRWHGVPLGYIRVPVVDGLCQAKAIQAAITTQFGSPPLPFLLSSSHYENLLYDKTLLQDSQANVAERTSTANALPLVTVAVCTRDRPDDLARCLEAISQLHYPHLDCLVVDNGSRDSSIEHLVRARFPKVRYVCEQRPGLDWARNRAIAEARGDIIAYTDDDVIVDPDWVLSLVRVFQENPDVMAVTGLVVPYALETEAQLLFEIYGGFGRGFVRKRYQLQNHKSHWYDLGTGQIGTGANMAYRRRLFETIGGFDPALDVGTVTNGGGDLEMFFRVLKEGHTILYEPTAIVRHRHRRSYQQLRTQIANNGVGLVSFWVRTVLAYPDEGLNAVHIGIRYLVTGYLRRLVGSYSFPVGNPRDLLLAELRGYLLGLSRFFQSRRIAAELAIKYSSPQDEYLNCQPMKSSHTVDKPSSHVTQPLSSKTEQDAQQPLSPSFSVSIVVATLDRPHELRECLHCLSSLKVIRPIEIIVVDNNPSSGLTKPIVAEFSNVKLVQESRRGLAYARNAGILASTGDIAVATDDDVRVPPDWLEKLVAPFARADVMVVTGNVLPLTLETQAQRLFEVYGGLGRGDKPMEVGGAWFALHTRHAVPTWRLGATANAAFRTSIFTHPGIGLMDEALGPGMPSGVGEDTYLFYKVLKAGYTLVYNPLAYVWHIHRRDMKALRSQLYAYSKGHIAYHLTTLLRDGDKRALWHIFHLTGWRIKQVGSVLNSFFQGHPCEYPLSLVLLEIAGNLAGPWALWRSRRRVQREGRSQLPVVTAAARTHTALRLVDTPHSQALEVMK
jgi:GT2 family glycosyltransferase